MPVENKDKTKLESITNKDQFRDTWYPNRNFKDDRELTSVYHSHENSRKI